MRFIQYQKPPRFGVVFQKIRLRKFLKEATQIHPTGLGRCIWEHPDVPCLEYRSRAIAEATEDGSLLHGREDGEPISGEHVAYERRHIFGRNLRKWIEENFPMISQPSCLTT